MKVEPNGGGFKYVDEITFMDPANVKDFRPFSLRPTADGRGFYVTDWAYSGWLAKVKAGRLWKVTYTKDDVKPAPRGKSTDSVEDLIKALDHPARSERMRAQYELLRRGKEIVVQLSNAGTDQYRSTFHHLMFHRLWIFSQLSPDRALSAVDQIIRNKNTSFMNDTIEFECARVLATWHPSGDLDSRARLKELDDLRLRRDALLCRLLKTFDPAVQIQAIWALSDPFALETITQLLELKSRVSGLQIEQAIVQRLQRSGNWEVLVAASSIKKTIPVNKLGKVRLCYALTEQYESDATILLQRLAMDFDPDIRNLAIMTLSRNAKSRPSYAGGWWGTQPAAQKPPARTVAWKDTPTIRDALVKAIGDEAAEVRKTAIAGLIELKEPQTLDPLIKQLDAEKNADTRFDLIRAIAALNLPKAIPTLSIELRKAENPESARLEIVKALEALKQPDATEALVLSAVKCDNEVVQARAVEALGNLKVKEYIPAIIKGLTHESPLMRKAAVIALGKFGDVRHLERMVALLGDPDSTVQNTAVQAIGGMQLKEGIPFLIIMAGREPTQFNAILALTKTPDVKAIHAYMTGLSSKSPELRTACRQAFLTIREPATKVLEELHQRKELPAGALPELRSIYSAFQPIVSWHLIGPFRSNGKSHPPEKELNFEAVYPGADKEVRWQKDQKSPDKLHGMIDLDGKFSPNENVLVYGYAEIESSVARDATLLIGSDDTMKVWVNDKKVFEFNGNRGWSHDSDKANVKLEKGKNKLLIQCGNASGPWSFLVAYTAEGGKHAFLQGVPEKLDLGAFRDFARKNKGDATRGRTLFADLKGLACIKCHAVGGQGGNVGPSLEGIALKYAKEELMTSILEPSKTIANGYETIKITTLDGKNLIGVFKGETGDTINLADIEGKLIAVAKKDIEDRKFSPISTMPNGLNDGMTLQDFADVVAYLEARREEPKKLPKPKP